MNPILMECKQLRKELDQTQNAMECARNHFEQTNDPTLIDCYIFELNAACLRYKFLLRKLKKLEPVILSLNRNPKEKRKDDPLV